MKEEGGEGRDKGDAEKQYKGKGLTREAGSGKIEVTHKVFFCFFLFWVKRNRRLAWFQPRARWSLGVSDRARSGAVGGPLGS